jgi:hypothetical protein
VAIIHQPKKLYMNDKLTPRLINDIVETVTETYRLLGLELLKASPIDWGSLEGAFSVNADGDLILSYACGSAPTFRLDGEGRLMLSLPYAGQGGEENA